MVLLTTWSPWGCFDLDSFTVNAASVPYAPLRALPLNPGHLIPLVSPLYDQMQFAPTNFEEEQG
jgi:hypothetical protein